MSKHAQREAVTCSRSTREAVAEAGLEFALLILFGCPFYCSTWFTLVTFREKRNSPLIHIFFIRPLILYSSFIKEYIKHHLGMTPNFPPLYPLSPFSLSPPLSLLSPKAFVTRISASPQREHFSGMGLWLP